MGTSARRSPVTSMTMWPTDPHRTRRWCSFRIPGGHPHVRDPPSAPGGRDDPAVGPPGGTAGTLHGAHPHRPDRGGLCHCNSAAALSDASSPGRIARPPRRPPRPDMALSDGTVNIPNSPHVSAATPPRIYARWSSSICMGGVVLFRRHKRWQEIAELLEVRDAANVAPGGGGFLCSGQPASAAHPLGDRRAYHRSSLIVLRITFT